MIYRERGRAAARPARPFAIVAAPRSGSEARGEQALAVLLAIGVVPVVQGRKVGRGGKAGLVRQHLAPMQFDGGAVADAGVAGSEERMLGRVGLADALQGVD